jgi:predicted esterase
MKTKLILVILLTLILLLIQPAAVTTKVLILISEQFPQVPVKPLNVHTKEPKREYLSLGNGVVADLFLPNRTGQKPALIIAMGVRTNEKDKPILLGFADTLARLGYVVIWPRLEDLDKEIVKYERPQTFIKAFEYLEQHSKVERNRISYIGFSVGSSLAMVAAEDPGINNQVRSLIFFGGYYNIFDYLKALATKSFVLDGQNIAWNPAGDGVNHAKGILEKDGLELEQFKNVGEIPESQKNALLRFSPDQRIENYKAPIFIMHEKADNYVPYVESIKLRQALEGKILLTFHLANIFEHVQPKQGFSTQMLGEFIELFGFLHKVFLYL